MTKTLVLFFETASRDDGSIVISTCFVIKPFLCDGSSNFDSSHDDVNDVRFAK